MVSTLHHFAANTEPFLTLYHASGGLQARNGLPLTPKQMQQIGAALLALLLLFAGKLEAYGRNAITQDPKQDVDDVSCRVMYPIEGCLVVLMQVQATSALPAEYAGAACRSVQTG